MAIKINGTTVIDDSRNVSNTVCVCATTCVATPVVCAGQLFGAGAGITGLGTFICAIACTNLLSGDPVSMCCSCGVGSLSSPPSFRLSGLIPVQNTQLSGCAKGVSADSIALCFACSPNCFAVVDFKGTFFLGGCRTPSQSCSACCQQDGVVAINAFTVSDSGSISNATNICCYVLPACDLCCGCTSGPSEWKCGYDDLRDCSGGPLKMICAPSCTGSMATVIMCTCRCYITCSICGYFCSQLKELKLCFCTTTCQISVVSFCCVGIPDGNSSSVRVSFVTPDQCYFVSVQRLACNGMGAAVDCACHGWGVNVKTLTNSTCFLCYPNATISSGCPFNSIFPATCVQFCSVMQEGNYELVSPFSYGVDGWIPIWVNVGFNNSNTYCVCYDQRVFAFKPTGENTVETTCNIICPRATLCCIPFRFNASCQFCMASQCTAMVRSFDQGDCVKRHLFQIRSNDDQLMYKYICLAVCTGNCLCVTGNTNTTFCCSMTDSCIYRQFYSQCWPTLGDSGGSFSTCFKSLYSLMFYRTMIPICYQCSCYLTTACCAALAGRSPGSVCNYYDGLSGTFLMCSATFQYCQNPNCFTLSCCFLPISGFTVCHCSLRCADSVCTCVFPGPYSINPILLNSGTTLISAGNGHKTPTGVICAGNCCSVPYVMAYSSVPCNNLCCFIGIVQNTVSAGGVACYVVPGMIDRSAFGCRFFTNCVYNTGPIQIGTCTNCITTTDTVTLFGDSLPCTRSALQKYPNRILTFNRYYDCFSGNTSVVIGSITNQC